MQHRVTPCFTHYFLKTAFQAFSVEQGQMDTFHRAKRKGWNSVSKELGKWKLYVVRISTDSLVESPHCFWLCLKGLASNNQSYLRCIPRCKFAHSTFGGTDSFDIIKKLISIIKFFDLVQSYFIMFLLSIDNWFLIF